MRNLVRDMLNMRHLLRRTSGGTPETVGYTRLELGKIWAGDINLGVIRVQEVIKAMGQYEVTLEVYREKKTT